MNSNGRAVIGHRGNGKNSLTGSDIPENTLKAFRAADDAGVDAFETDIRLTKDRVPILFHDHEYKDKLVSDYTFQELKSEIPEVTTFEELIQAFPQKPIYLELKHEVDNDYLLPFLAEKYRSNLTSHQIKVISFTMDFLVKIKSLCPEAYCGWIATSVFSDPGRLKLFIFKKDVEYVKKVNIDAIYGHYLSFLTRSAVKKGKRLGVEVGVGMINNRFWFYRSQWLGIRLVFTDYPQKVIHWINQSAWRFK
ncbi:MAG: glycerophosphodiester phosphodiesterase [Candidatus Dojkabacteria bacterium]